MFGRSANCVSCLPGKEAILLLNSIDFFDYMTHYCNSCLGSRVRRNPRLSQDMQDAPRLLIAIGNSIDPDPARLTHEANWGARRRLRCDRRRDRDATVATCVFKSVIRLDGGHNSRMERRKRRRRCGARRSSCTGSTASSSDVCGAIDKRIELYSPPLVSVDTNPVPRAKNQEHAAIHVPARSALVTSGATKTPF